MTMEGYFTLPRSLDWSFTIRCSLVSYTEHIFYFMCVRGGFLPFCRRYHQHILNPADRGCKFYIGSYQHNKLIFQHIMIHGSIQVFVLFTWISIFLENFSSRSTFITRSESIYPNKFCINERHTREIGIFFFWFKFLSKGLKCLMMMMIAKII